MVRRRLKGLARRTGDAVLGGFPIAWIDEGATDSFDVVTPRKVRHARNEPTDAAARRKRGA